MASEREQRLICAPSVCSVVNAESAKPRPNQCLGGLQPTCPREHINVRSPGDPRLLPQPPPPGPRCGRQDDLSLTPKPSDLRSDLSEMRNPSGEQWGEHADPTSSGADDRRRCFNLWQCLSVCPPTPPPRFQLIGPRQAEKAGGGLTAHFLTGRSALFNWDSV